MKNNWLYFMNPNDGCPYIFPLEPLLSKSFRGHTFSQLNSFVDNSLHQSRFLYIPGSMAFQEALKCMSKLAGALLFWFTSSSSSNLTQQISGNQHGPRVGSSHSLTQVKHITSTKHELTGFRFGYRSKGESSSLVVLGKISSFMRRLLCREAERLQSFPVFSFAAALVPPLENLPSKVLAVPLENGDGQVQRSIDQRPCEVGPHGCSGFSFPDLNWTRHAVEPRTGIEFPVILDNILAEEHKSSLTSEVLVGTGSKSMKIIKVKSLKVYAFGFYVHPNSVCEKLGQKYASVPSDELNKCRDFYEDLLREEIGMTVRLVINCNGMKINTVKNAFEKSLRARLQKGTTVDFRRTADGQLITEIGGEQIGAVHSKELCRAFFDMYLGDIPVSEQTKEDIGNNVGSILRRC
ncbi:fatty-acid-binding protein 2 isoform X2 [Manihot esculenta]|uniref:fatty-acid-binding protein 2 isoform X2 n=1 Tax=Manihot esculenta TaxID=3983 RepID=UPI001CC61079|nr:fatty-acid-binding protein 2 isoform X2 [Manihot esculenta]